MRQVQICLFLELRLCSAADSQCADCSSRCVVRHFCVFMASGPQTFILGFAQSSAPDVESN